MNLTEKIDQAKKSFHSVNNSARLTEVAKARRKWSEAYNRKCRLEKSLQHAEANELKYRKEWQDLESLHPEQAELIKEAERLLTELYDLRRQAEAPTTIAA